MNTEVGGRSLKDVIRLPKGAPDDPEDEKNGNNILTTEEAKFVIDEVVKDKYQHQLPQPIADKFTYSNYENCAQGEQLNDKFVCWSEKMTNNDSGSECPVFAGHIKTCPAFINKILIDNPDFLRRSREAGNTIRDIATVAGCSETGYDNDVRDRIVWYFKKYDIPLK